MIRNGSNTIHQVIKALIRGTPKKTYSVALTLATSLAIQGAEDSATSFAYFSAGEASEAAEPEDTMNAQPADKICYMSLP